MKYQYIAEFARELLNSELVVARRARGCPMSEIEVVESQLGLKFPDAYREFLLLGGRDAGEFLLGSEYRIEDVVKNQQMIKDEAAADGVQVTWPSDSFVFASHQGYTYCLFRISGDPDPFVFIVDLVQGVNEKGIRFSDFLIQLLRQQLSTREARRELGQTKDWRRGADSNRKM